VPVGQKHHQGVTVAVAVGFGRLATARKPALIKGPKEFREIREDLPKLKR